LDTARERLLGPVLVVGYQGQMALNLSFPIDVKQREAQEGRLHF
jgi:hypothetical protein